MCPSQLNWRVFRGQLESLEVPWGQRPMNCVYKWIGVKSKEMRLLVQRPLLQPGSAVTISKQEQQVALYASVSGLGSDPERLDWSAHYCSIAGYEACDLYV